MSMYVMLVYVCDPPLSAYAHLALHAHILSCTYTLTDRCHDRLAKEILLVRQVVSKGQQKH